MDYPNFRKVVAACPCHGGEVAFCDDGAIFFSFPDADKRRVHVEGTPIPGTPRAHELGEAATAAFVPQWEAIARNLAQASPENHEIFKRQCEAHGITP